ncbi:MAG TPA: isoprenylcysteine carboxylmethyltransferase family protein [Thermoanaerobaculia bacterium]|jgi:protein-S-isoprenylcysteine O-methyltransferase Ste14|nr:isoprenylcysteine carboxylmethyltransferase family protein [Thermoanaerobaculia bacterium]
MRTSFLKKEELAAMDITHTANGLQIARTRQRLLLTRLFGLTILSLVVFGSSFWTGGATLFDDMLFLVGLLLAVVGVCGRLWCLSYICGQKKRVLITTGPYSLCRHPLYFFSFVGGIGLGLCTEMLSVAGIFALAFALYYPPAIRGEEAFLSGNFPDYEEYRKRVPLFFPRLSNFVEGEGTLCVRRFRRELMAAGGFLLFIGVFELLEALHEASVLPTYFLLP